MGEEGLLRIWSIRPAASTAVIDSRIRDAILPAAASTDGLDAFFAARRGTDVSPERVLASVWDTADGIERARSADGLIGLEATLESKGSEEVMSIVFSVTAPTPPVDPPAILRIFRGRTRPNELPAYVEAARRGTGEDIAAGAGPVALFLAEADPEHFVTVSVWTGWTPIEIATGGNIASPIATRHTTHLVSGTAAHYELFPNAITGRIRLATG